MNVLTINPLMELRTVLLSEGISSDIYINGVPTAGVPDSYISLMQNGSAKPKTIKLTSSEVSVAVIIGVKLLSNGTVNTIKEGLILSGIGSLFHENKQVRSGSYLISLDASNLGGGGRGISSGYSTKIINLSIKIY